MRNAPSAGKIRLVFNMDRKLRNNILLTAEAMKATARELLKKANMMISLIEEE